jgi:hypothetical protein
VNLFLTRDDGGPRLALISYEGALMRKVILQEFLTLDMKLLNAKTLDLGAVSLKYIQGNARSVDAGRPDVR